MNWSQEDIDTLRANWGQSHEEICSNFGLDEEDANDVLMDDYFWDDEANLWIPKCSSLMNVEEQQIAAYLRNK